MQDTTRFDGYRATSGFGPTGHQGPPSPRNGLPVPAQGGYPPSPPVGLPAPYPGPPRGPVPAPGPRRAGRTAAIVLSVAAVLLVIATGVLGYLYVAATGEHDAAGERLADRRTELAAAEDRVTTAEADRDRAEADNSALETENRELGTCVTAVQHYLWDGLTGAARDAALDRLFTECQ